VLELGEEVGFMKQIRDLYSLQRTCSRVNDRRGWKDLIPFTTKGIQVLNISSRTHDHNSNLAFS
jgi:hypothetical protein